MNAVDTNVLVYANDSREPIKKKTASDLITSLSDGVLLWQVACEYVAAARKLEKFGFTQADAFADLALLRGSWQLALPTWTTLDQAETLFNKHSLSFWDALLVAACIESGVTKLYSEDIKDYFRKDGLEVINPFLIT